MDALASRSAALRKVELVSPRHVLGKNTVEAMQSGAVIGFAGLVDGVVARIRAEVPGMESPGVVVVATGDSASLVAPESTVIDRVEPTLTLDGLQLVHERNRARRR